MAVIVSNSFTVGRPFNLTGLVIIVKFVAVINNFFSQMSWQESLHNTMCRKQKRKIYIWFYEEATRNNNLETINKYCNYILSRTLKHEHTVL